MPTTLRHDLGYFSIVLMSRSELLFTSIGVVGFVLLESFNEKKVSFLIPILFFRVLSERRKVSL